MFGVDAIREYLSGHIITSLIPAFFIAGAIASFVSKSAVIDYLGPKANKILAYTIASISGAILAVCSCTILPLFAGIRKRGAGLGPAIAFLFSGPAINLLAIIYSARLLGYDIGIFRAVGAILFSIVIGLIMALIFGKEEERINDNAEWNFGKDELKTSNSKIAAFFITLVLFMIATSSINLVFGIDSISMESFALAINGEVIPALIALTLLVVIIIFAVKWFQSEDISEWMTETWKLLKKILPYLLLGVFLAGIIKELLPPEVVQKFVGENTIISNVLAAALGSLMYFCTLTEVPIVKALMDLGMSKGPALTLLLAGPSLSIPNMIVIGKILGLKKTAVYIALVVVLSSTTGLIFGYLF
jgi:uncharacterized membrane protein YraQ (UPF0718 family)